MSRNGLCLSGVAACIALSAVLGAFVLPGTTRADHRPGHKPGNGGGEVGQVIQVCFDFDDAPGDGVQSDGGGEYCNGGKTEAVIGRNFSAVADGNTSNKSNAGRTLFLNLTGGLSCASSVKVDNNRPSASGEFGDGVCDDCVDAVPLLPTARFGTPTSLSGFPDNAKLEILGRDLDDLTAALSPFATNARLTFSVGADNWILHWGPFKNPGGPTFCPESDPVSVTRSSTNVADDTWTFETTGSHLACLYLVPKNSDPVYHGQLVVPFRVKAVAMPDEFVGVPDGSTTLMAGSEVVGACDDS